MATTDKHRLAPSNWAPYFHKANVRVEELQACKANHAKAVKMGRFLSPNVGREVSIEANGRTGKAILRAAEGRSKQKQYYFEVRWDDQSTAASTASNKSAAAMKVKGVGRRSTKKAKKVKSVKTPPHVEIKPDTEKKPAKNPTGGNEEDW